MRLCVPSDSLGGLKDNIGFHFGRVDNYTIIDSETKAVEIVPNTSSHKGGTKYPAELLKDHGVEVMICSGVGNRAIKMFEEFGIEVYTGAQGTIEDAITFYEEGKLEMATDANVCREHKYHDDVDHH